MKIALASFRFADKDLDYNQTQIEQGMREAKRQGAQLVCFGESFLQGFECLCWDYEADKHMAAALDSDLIQNLCRLSKTIGIDLAVGFIEAENEALYSSYALFCEGKLFHRYRRISKGWKERMAADEHYREGKNTDPFLYRGKRCMIALCGDLWDAPQLFSERAELLLWPIFVNFTVEQWQSEELKAYGEQAGSCCRDVLLINSVSENDPPAYGGCVHFENGQVKEILPMGQTGLLIVDL